MPRRQVQPGVAPGLGIGQALQAGRGADQHAGGLGKPRPHHGHVAGVVDHALLLLEGGLVFLVHHHQAKVGVGQEQRRARPDQHLHLTLRHGAPGVPPGLAGQLAVPQRRRHAEARAEPVQPLR